MASLKSLRTSLAQNREEKGRLEEQLRVERELGRRHESDIEKNKNFTYTVEEQVIEAEPNEPGSYTTNCLTCNMACHENCPFPNDESRRKCPAMDNNGYCKVCPMHCSWDMHKNQPYAYVVKIHTITKTAHDLKRRYEEAMQKKAEFEILVARRTKELEKVNNEIYAAERKLSQTKLDERHLLQVSKKITYETERTELGLNLGIPDSEIRITKRNNRDEFTMANYDMLKKWFVTTSDRNDAWEELVKALRKCKLNQIVAEVLTVNDA